MPEIERVLVGRVLDSLRDVLAPYVDAAMTTAYGSDWDARVADQNAGRRSDGRRFPVSKTDLAVVLKAIHFERIAPWSSSERSSPRIRGYSSEILTVRNLWAHGEECVDEHSRLLDTAARLLKELGLAVPDHLVAPIVDEVEVRQAAPLPTSPLDGEVSRLGPEAEHLTTMLAQVAQLLPALLSRSEGDRDAVLAVGRTAFGLLQEADVLEADGRHEKPALRMLLSFLRASILGDQLLVATILGHISEVGSTGPEDLELAKAYLAQFESWMAIDSRDRSRAVISLAQQMDEGSILANSTIILTNLELATAPSTPQEETLALWRDSSTRSRMLAAMEPGSQWETYTVMFLRREGMLCNDLERPDEAIRAFARADEIIDRYPTADPDLAVSNS